MATWRLRPGTSRLFEEFFEEPPRHHIGTGGTDEKKPGATASKTNATDKHQLAKDVYARMLVSAQDQAREGKDPAKDWSRLLDGVDPFVIQRLVNELQEFLEEPGGSEGTSSGKKQKTGQRRKSVSLAGPDDETQQGNDGNDSEHTTPGIKYHRKKGAW